MYLKKKLIITKTTRSICRTAGIGFCRIFSVTIDSTIPEVLRKIYNLQGQKTLFRNIVFQLKYIYYGKKMHILLIKNNGSNNHSTIG